MHLKIYKMYIKLSKVSVEKIFKSKIFYGLLLVFVKELSMLLFWYDPNSENSRSTVKVSYVLPRVFKIIKISCIRMDNIVYFCCQEHTCLSLMLNNLFYTEKIKNIKCIL